MDNCRYIYVYICICVYNIYKYVCMYMHTQWCAYICMYIYDILDGGSTEAKLLISSFFVLLLCLGLLFLLASFCTLLFLYYFLWISLRKLFTHGPYVCMYICMYSLAACTLEFFHNTSVSLLLLGFAEDNSASKFCDPLTTKQVVINDKYALPNL